MNLEHAVATASDDKYTLAIYVDEDPQNPREWDNLGKMICWHSRYNLGDEQQTDDPNDWLIELAAPLEDVPIDRLKDFRRVWKILTKHLVILPLALLDHSGLHMWVGKGPHWSDTSGWDSGQVGWIYMTREQILRESPQTYKNPKANRVTQKMREWAEKVLEQEVEAYNQYLNGDVYGFVLYEKQEGELKGIDSCWGFYGHQFESDGYLGEHLPEDACYLVKELK